MKAILRTRCGCDRRIEVPNPPPPDWRVPLPRSYAFGGFDGQARPDRLPEGLIRVFDLANVKQTGRYEFTAFYEERA